MGKRSNLGKQPRAKGAPRKLRGELAADSGAQLVELALSLPLLFVLVIAVTDFGQAYNTKHILTNAALEAARITISNPVTDYNCTTTIPCPIEAAADAVQVYLTNAGLGDAVNGKKCSLQASGSGTDPWTFTCNNVSLTINRKYVITGGPGGPVNGTDVKLSYPYTWTLTKIMGLLVKNNALSLPTTISTEVVMQNLVSN